MSHRRQLVELVLLMMSLFACRCMGLQCYSCRTNVGQLDCTSETCVGSMCAISKYRESGGDIVAKRCVESGVIGCNRSKRVTLAQIGANANQVNAADSGQECICNNGNYCNSLSLLNNGGVAPSHLHHHMAPMLVFIVVGAFVAIPALLN